VIYEGQVQGVGFRYTTHRIAHQFQVCGYVRNLSDGTVELLAEGDQSEIDRFLNAIANTMSSFVTEIKIDQTEATGEFIEFSILF